MPPVATPAIVLGSLRYGETSKIVRLATREHGVQSAIAKGASRPKSKFGAALQLLSEGQAHLLMKDGRDLHTLTGFDVQKVRIGLADQLDRYATATALAEVMLRCAPPVVHPEAYDLLRNGLEALEIAPPVVLEALALRILWGLVGVLGFAPVLDACARDGEALGGKVGFSFREGGALCTQCSPTRAATTLDAKDLAELRLLVAAGDELPPLDEKHATAHRRLLTRWVREHLGEGAPLPALEFWQMRSWAAR